MKTNINFPKNPYNGMIYYHPTTKKTFEYLIDITGGSECPETKWYDISDEDLVPWQMQILLNLDKNG